MDPVADVLSRVANGEFRSLRQAALATGIPKSTLSDRARGTVPRDQITLANSKLTKQQENILAYYIQDLQA